MHDKGTSRAGKGGITDATDFAARFPARFAPETSWTSTHAACMAGAVRARCDDEMEACDMSKSSSLAGGAKIYYRPIRAAIRWSGLLRFERRIPNDRGGDLCQRQLSFRAGRCCG